MCDGSKKATVLTSDFLVRLNVAPELIIEHVISQAATISYFAFCLRSPDGRF